MNPVSLTFKERKYMQNRVLYRYKVSLFVYSMFFIMLSVHHTTNASGIDPFDMDELAQGPTYGSVVHTPELTHLAEKAVQITSPYASIQNTVSSWYCAFIYRYCAFRSWVKNMVQRTQSMHDTVGE